MSPADREHIGFIEFLRGGLVGWLLAWLVGWLLAWLVGWLVGWLNDSQQNGPLCPIPNVEEYPE